MTQDSIDAESATRGETLDAAVAEALGRLTSLATAMSGGQASSLWLHEVQHELDHLCRLMRDRTLMHEWTGTYDGTWPCRPDALAQMEQFGEQRRAHAVALDRLVVDAARVDTREGADATSLRTQIADWVEQQRRLDARGPDLIFRLFWDDVGGEA